MNDIAAETGLPASDGRKPSRYDGRFPVFGFIARYWLRHPWLVGSSTLFTVLAIICDLAIPFASGKLVDSLARGPGQAGNAWWAWGLFVAAYVGFHLSRTGAQLLWNPVSAKNMEELVQDGFRKVQSFSSNWFSENLAGVTVRNLSRGMWGYDMASDAVVIHLTPAVLVLVGIIVSMGLRWPAAGVLALVVSILYIASNLVLNGRFIVEANKRAVALDSEMGGIMADAISSNATVKAFGAEKREEARLAATASSWRDAALKVTMRFSVLQMIHGLLLIVLQAGLTGLVLLLWTEGRATVGDLAFVLAATALMNGYLRNIGDNVRLLQQGLADAAAVAGYSRTDPEIRDDPGAPPMRISAGEVVFDRVTYRHRSARAPIFKDLSLTIKPGEHVALVGATGSGKSTFAKLLQRLYEVESGAISVDAQDISKVTQESLRQSIGVVPQDQALFHRSVEENILYGRPEAPRDQLEAVAQRAQAHQFIVTLSEGYGTLVGEKGVKLSGGERQRVAIARAALANSPVLILDEATSSLDVETERLVQQAIDELRAGKTTIVIAHRLATVRRADRILVFEDGRIVEEGSHSELVGRGGVYARLHACNEMG